MRNPFIEVPSLKQGKILHFADHSFITWIAILWFVLCMQMESEPNISAVVGIENYFITIA